MQNTVNVNLAYPAPCDGSYQAPGTSCVWGQFGCRIDALYSDPSVNVGLGQPCHVTVQAPLASQRYPHDARENPGRTRSTHSREPRGPATAHLRSAAGSRPQLPYAQGLEAIDSHAVTVRHLRLDSRAAANVWGIADGCIYSHTTTAGARQRAAAHSASKTPVAAVTRSISAGVLARARTEEKSRG